MDDFTRNVIFLICLLLGFITGLLFGGRAISVSPLELNIRGEQCDSNDGVKEFIIKSSKPNVRKVICKNGAVFTTGEHNE